MPDIVLDFGRGVGRPWPRASMPKPAGADCVYWRTQRHDASAHSPYNVNGHAASFVVYER